MRKRRLPVQSALHLDIAEIHLKEALELVAAARKNAKINPDLLITILADTRAEILDALRKLDKARWNEEE